MKYTFYFQSLVSFDYATVVTGLETFTVEHAIDVDNNLIWVNDIKTATQLFDDAGVDELDYKIVDTPKSEYKNLLTRMAEKLAAAEAALVSTDEKSEDGFTD
jgi:hypothetical protein